MRLNRSSVVMLCVVVAIFLICTIGIERPGESGRTPVPTLVSWEGKAKMESRTDAPKAGFVADRERWEQLWKAWRGTEAVPTIDFKEAVVLVAAGGDPNRITAIPTLDPEGNLRVTYMSTLIGFTNPEEFAYQFALIRREGIKSVGGKAID